MAKLKFNQRLTPEQERVQLRLNQTNRRLRIAKQLEKIGVAEGLSGEDLHVFKSLVYSLMWEMDKADTEEVKPFQEDYIKEWAQRFKSKTERSHCHPHLRDWLDKTFPHRYAEFTVLEELAKH
jgi:hypothetical protein